MNCSIPNIYFETNINAFSVCLCMCARACVYQSFTLAQLSPAVDTITHLTYYVTRQNHSQNVNGIVEIQWVV